MTARYWPCYRCSHGGKLFTEFPGIRYCTVPGYAAGSPSWHWRLLFMHPWSQLPDGRWERLDRNRKNRRDSLVAYHRLAGQPGYWAWSTWDPDFGVGWWGSGDELTAEAAMEAADRFARECLSVPKDLQAAYEALLTSLRRLP